MSVRRVLLAGLVVMTAACGGGSGDPTITTTATTSTTRPTTTTTTLPPMGCDGAPIVPGAKVTCEVPGWTDRLVDVHVPIGYDQATVWPVVVSLHGGGGNREAGIRTTCPNGDLDNPLCLDNVGDREGFFTLSPDGTGVILRAAIRTWNAGGSGDLDCVSGRACADAVDDVAYVSDMLDLVGDFYNLEVRVVVTGLSNGGAMSHRLGCELADRVRVVAAVAGANQNPGCVPSMPISVLHIHGTADENWPFEGGTLGRLANEARVTGAEATVADWADILGCGVFREQAIPDLEADGMSSIRRDSECASGQKVTLVVVQGGGHTWPQGHQFAAPVLIGELTQDFNANELIWEFVEAVSPEP